MWTETLSTVGPKKFDPSDGFREAAKPINISARG